MKVQLKIYEKRLIRAIIKSYDNLAPYGVMLTTKLNTTIWCGGDLYMSNYITLLLLLPRLSPSRCGSASILMLPYGWIKPRLQPYALFCNFFLFFFILNVNLINFTSSREDNGSIRRPVVHYN